MAATGACGGEGDEDVSGQVVFVRNCATCHKLEAAGSVATVGPDLDALQPSAEKVEAFVRNGSGVMPSFEGRLSDSEIEAVAEYVDQAAGR